MVVVQRTLKHVKISILHQIQKRYLLIKLPAKETILIIVPVLLLVAACKESVQTTDIQGPDKVSYPQTATIDQNDDYFGTNISDPYRWLETKVILLFATGSQQKRRDLRLPGSDSPP